METKLIFPTVMICLMVCASFVYLWHGDYRHALYWVLGASINATVTY